VPAGDCLTHWKPDKQIGIGKVGHENPSGQGD